MARNFIKFDESRKPRRTRGTPSYYFRNKFAFGVIATGCAIFGLFSCTHYFTAINEKFANIFYTPSQEEIDRKIAFSFVGLKKSDELLKMLKEQEDFKKDF